MDAWTRVIVEWVNCLGIIESSIEDIQDLHDGIFYKKLISQLYRGNKEIFTGAAIETIDGKELVSKFIEAEYPKFHQIDNSLIAVPENLYVASLLLIQCSQQPTFHRPMCLVLKHETQIQVKRFLELVLPHGKKITRESIVAAITEIVDVASEDCPKTPTIRPLREFLNSPAVRSVRSQRFMNDRNRELIALKAQLETEQFEKLDLQQDLKVQEERIQNMQKKLQEKSRELRELRNEKFRPVTPKSCSKKRSSDMEERLMREIEKLETTNFNLQAEVEKLRDEKEEITRRVTSESRVNSCLKQRLEVVETNFDIISGQLEMKENEIFDLKMNCEELREHIRQISRSEIKDESFDFELPSEALSSIVDIQLQEARKESSQLKVQLEKWKQKFENEKKTSGDLQNCIQEKSAELVDMKTLLMEMESRLEFTEKKSLNFEMENSRLIEEMKKIDALVESKEQLVNLTEQRRKDLEAKYEEMVLRIQNLDILLKNENSRVVDLESMVKTLENEAQDLKNILTLKEKELMDEQNEATKILSEKVNLSKELDKCVESIENLKERIGRIEHECASSEEKLQQEFEKNEKLRKTETDLQEKLIEQQNKMAEILSKNRNLEEELSSYVQSAVDQKRLEAELQEATLKIQNLEVLLKNENSRVSDLESMVTTSKNEAQDLKNLLARKEEELINEKNVGGKILSEKINLAKELDKCVKSIDDLKENIARMEDECATSEEKLQQEFEKNEELRKTETDLQEKLIEKQNKMAEILSKNRNLEEELSSYVQSAVDQKLLEAELQEATLKIQNLEVLLKNENSRVSDLESMVTTSKNEAQDLKNLLARKEEELINEKNVGGKILSEKINLAKELDKCVKSIDDLKENIARMEDECATSEEKLQQEFEKNEELRKTETDLQEKLIEQQNKMAIILSKNRNLEEELSSYVQSMADQSEKLANLEKELEKTTKNLQNQAELKRLGEKLEDELAQQRKESQVLEMERNRLEIELLNSSSSIAKMTEQIAILQSELELSHKDLQKLQDLSAIDRERLKSENAILVKDLNEKIINLTNLNTLLENKLRTVEKSCEEVKIEEKSKTAALQVVREKYDELSREKIESELRMKELVLNLQEVRASQDEVMRAQKEALKKNALQVVESEKELERLNNRLTEKTNEVENEKVLAENQRMELERLKETNLSKESLVEELNRLLDIERQEVCEKTKHSEILQSQLVEIEQVSRSLKTELNALWASIRDACPELAKNEKGEVDETIETDIIHTVASFAQDARAICKAVSILSEANETLKEHLDDEKEIRKNSAEETEKHKLKLENEVAKCNLRFSLLARRNKNMQNLLSRTIVEREKIEEELDNCSERWKILENEVEQFLITGCSDCDELKHLRIEKNCIDDLLTNLIARRSTNTKQLLKTLCEIFVWSETKLHEAQDFSIKVEPSTEASEEEDLLKPEIRENEKMCEDLKIVAERMSQFSKSLKCYEASVKSGIIKRESTSEEKLKIAFEKLTKERNEMKEKLEAVRIRNVKMEKNMDELRNENKKLKAQACETSVDRLEVERMKVEINRLKEEKEELKEQKEELKKNTVDEKGVDARLEEVHNEYGLKLEKIKQKMKAAYNEQIAKLNQEQERAIKEKIEALRQQTEAQCRKYTEDIAKYKAHISDLSSRYWDVGEKLLAETQEKQAALLQLQRLRGQQQQQQQQRGEIAEVNERTSMPLSRQKTASLDRREFIADRAMKEPPERSGSRAVEVIEEETTTFRTRRHSVMSIQAMGNAFNAEDEEGEVFDSVYLADLKEGRFPPIAPDLDRLSELRMRNSMCRPHLKSSYAVETNLQPVALNEDDIKNGVPSDDVFNDSLSQSLLPGQKPKRKDRTQTSYKKPGPPTPSKNGGRLSLQGNELKSPSSRILKERNVDRRTTATPRGLKNLFGNSLSKRQDENTSTPKGRRLSNIFRKQRN